jgi:dTDP-4-dehydrorhamnose 3,5-epimerase
MPFNFKKLEIPDLILIEPKVFKDERGFFTEKYKQSEFKAQEIPDFVQDNYSYSKQGVIRGVHYQVPPYTQGKLVTVLKGKIWDVAVDMRKSSAYFGKWVGVELSDENNFSFYIPAGFAHGFAVLSSEALFLYKCTNEYNVASERGVRWDDPELNIDWKITNPIMTKKDLDSPLFKDTLYFN